MKRLILGVVSALTLASAATAQAATYSLTTSVADEAVITDARGRYNNSQPATICVPTCGTANPALKATNAAFMNMVFQNALASWDVQGAQPKLSVTEKTATITMLQAAVARADANSAIAQTLLDKINAAQ